MVDSASGSRKLIRYEDGGVRMVLDKVVTAWPVTIVVNGEEFATLVCSPEYVEDLAAGYLASEGVLEHGGSLTDLSRGTGWSWKTPCALSAEGYPRKCC